MSLGTHELGAFEIGAAPIPFVPTASPPPPAPAPEPAPEPERTYVFRPMTAQLVSPLPPPPSRRNPRDFNTRADNWNDALVVLTEQINAATPGDSAAGLAQYLALTGPGQGAQLVKFQQGLANSIARTLADKLAEFRSVKDFKCADGLPPQGNATHDDTTGIQAALDAVAAAGGGVVMLPPGQYRLTAKLVIPSFVMLMGAQWLPDPSNTAQVLHTSLYIDWGANQDNHAIEMRHSGGFEGITIYYPGQVAKTASTPTPYGFAISTPTAAGVYDNIHIRNVTLYNAYKGIRLNNGGRWRVENIQGDPLSVGFTADNCLDVCYMQSVHFWNFYTQGAALETWVAANGTAFDFARIDQLHGSHLFGWNRNKCFVARDGAWISLSNILCDKAGEPFRIELATNVQVNGFTLICSAAVRPAIWMKHASGQVSFSNGRITSASSVGYQVDDGAAVQFSNVAFQGPHVAGVTTSSTTKVSHASCTWTLPPLGGANVSIDGVPLPRENTTITLPAPTLTSVTSIASGYRFDLAAVAARQVAWDVSLISQRNGLYVLSFDYDLVGSSSTWYFKVLVQSDVGTNTQMAFAPLAPLRLNPSTATKRVRIPFFINHGRAGCQLKLFVETTAAVSGAYLDVTNIVLTEQASRFNTDAQIAMLMARGYNLDAYSMGQTLFSKGRARRIITDPEAGIGRSGATPTAGTWEVGDEILLQTPVAGQSPGVVCTTAGTFGGTAPVFKALPSLAA